MKKQKITAEKLIEMFKPIPEEDFIIRNYTNGNDKCCVIGHYERLTSENPNDYSFINCSDYHDGGGGDLREWSAMVIAEMGWSFYSLATVNNGRAAQYPQPTPKKRVMAFLEDARKAGY